MTKKLLPHWPLLLLLAILSPLWLLNVVEIPFHPDEASVLFQSRDLETFFQAPGSLIQGNSESSTAMEEYRALNAPLAKYTTGFGRRMMGVGPQEVSLDWDWQASWSSNLNRGAMPPLEALLGGRLASSLLGLLAVPWLYWAGVQLGGKPYGLAAAALYGLSGLALLHGRRAMAEGTLLFTICLLIALSLAARRWPLAAGIGAGLAFSAKHSALPLLLMPAIGSILNYEGRGIDPRFKRKLAITLAGFFAVFLLLNPFAWSNPARAAASIIDARKEFVGRQVEITESLAPGAILDSNEERVASLLGNTYLLPLQYQEVGNYQLQLQDAIGEYTRQAQYHWLMGGWQGAVRLGLLLLGFWGVIRGVGHLGNEPQGRFVILAAGSIALVGATLLLNPLPYQRYYLPLLPLLVLWEAAGVIVLAGGLKSAFYRLVG